MKPWFKLKYVFLGVILGVMAILFAEKNRVPPRLLAQSLSSQNSLSLFLEK